MFTNYVSLRSGLQPIPTRLKQTPHENQYYVIEQKHLKIIYDAKWKASVLSLRRVSAGVGDEMGWGEGVCVL